MIQNDFEQIWVDDVDITGSATIVRGTGQEQEVQVVFTEPSGFTQLSIKGSQNRNSGQNIGLTCTCTRAASIWNSVTGNPVTNDWKRVDAATDNLPTNWFFYSFNGGTDMGPFLASTPQTQTCAAGVASTSILTGGSRPSFFGFFLKVNQLCS